MRYFPDQTRRAAPVPLVAILLLAGCSPTSSEQAVRFTKPPYLQNPGQNEITIRWTTTLPTKCTVRYGARKSIAAILEIEPFDWVEAVPDGETREYLYCARLTGLMPGTHYRYDVTCNGTTIGGAFRTTPPTNEPFAFIVYEDSRTRPTVHSAVASCFRQHQPDFILHVGDMVSSGTYFEWQQEFFSPLSKILCDVPLWPARGNHEGDAVAFARPHPYLAAAASAHHYVVFRIEGDQLSLRALRLDGSEIDTLTITKASGCFDNEYLSEALPENEFEQGEEEKGR